MSDHLRSRPVMVTGGTGFVGSHLVHRLVREGAEVHVLARPEAPAARLADVAEGLTLWRGDLTDPASVARCLDGARPSIVFHLAGATDVRRMDRGLGQLDRSVDVNLSGTLNLLRAIHSGDIPMTRFIRAGGLEEYGHGAPPYSEDQRERPVSPYSASQVAAAHYCQMLQGRFSFPVVTLRLALVYGPGQSTDFFIPSLITHCLDGRDFTMTAGEQGRDLVFVEDVVEAFLRTAAAPEVAGEIINIGSGRESVIRDVAELILRLAGDGRSRLDIGRAEDRPTEIRHLVCRIDKAARLLGWSPTTGLEEGLGRTIRWYRRQMRKAAPSPPPPGPD